MLKMILDRQSFISCTFASLLIHTVCCSDGGNIVSSTPSSSSRAACSLDTPYTDSPTTETPFYERSKSLTPLRNP